MTVNGSKRDRGRKKEKRIDIKSDGLIDKDSRQIRDR